MARAALCKPSAEYCSQVSHDHLIMQQMLSQSSRRCFLWLPLSLEGLTSSPKTFKLSPGYQALQDSAPAHLCDTMHFGFGRSPRKPRGYYGRPRTPGCRARSRGRHCRRQLVPDCRDCGASAGGPEALEGFFAEMPVFEIAGGMVVAPNHVFITPPDRDLGILHGRPHLFEPPERRGGGASHRPLFSLACP